MNDFQSGAREIPQPYVYVYICINMLIQMLCSNYLPDIRMEERKKLEVSCFTLGMNANVVILNSIITSTVLMISHTALGLPLNAAQVSVQL